MKPRNLCVKGSGAVADAAGMTAIEALITGVTLALIIAALFVTAESERRESHAVVHDS
jgi:hypothetical protein